jgi:predicted TPR repeat methyltransferase
MPAAMTPPPDSPKGRDESVEVSVAELLAAAVAAHQQGHVEQAAAVYRAILEHCPDEVNALHFLGVAEHQLGDSQQALAHLDRALVLAPDHADAHNNRGNVWKKLGRLDEAEADYRQALALRADDANALNNLGTVLRHRGDLASAEAHFKRALAVQPAHRGAWSNLGGTLRRLGRVDEAIAVYRARLARCPDDARARHLLASCTGEDVPLRAADSYVRAEFDEFADSFDATLAQLEYHAPRLVEEEVARLFTAAQAGLAILDAGCGTGLCGPLLRPRATRLAGVDLSPGMIELARRRAVYDDLVVEELTAFLRRHERSFDVIVSADTLVYFGALEEVTLAAARSLRPGGALVFTVERVAAAEAPVGYRLNPHGRYSHTREYLLRVLDEVGLLERRLTEAELRKESGRWVAGWLVSARAPERAPEGDDRADREASCADLAAR